MGKRKKYPVLMTGCILLTGALLFSSCGKKEQDSDIEKEKPEIVPKEQEIMGLENIASYIELEKIGNNGMTRLMEMKAGYEWAGEGSLILNGFDEEEKAVAKRILDASDRVACWMIYRDFDGDGAKEAFVYACDLASGKGTELWFAAADGTVQKLLEANTYRTQNILELPEKTFYLYTIEGAYARGAFLYEVEGNTAKPAALQGAEYLGDGKFVVDCTGDNAFSLEAGGDAGSCWRNYYYYYDENGFHEYSGSPVTEEEFCQYENGSELLDAVKQCGDVEEIYYFADGRMIVNYVEDGVILDELYGGLVRRNHYLQVPILSEGEDGFVLAAENFSNILLMQRGELVGERGEHDLFLGDGNYQPFCQEELAKYPVYQSPLEYYREGYLEKAGDPEQILTDGIYQKGQEYLVDLDGDGAEESLFVGQKLLLVDGKNYNKFLYGHEDLDKESFYVFDLDQSDGILELGLLEHGANGNEFTWIFWYDGETLRSAGNVEGVWDRQGRWIVMDGKGKLVTNGRLSILQTWTTKMTFRLNKAHQLVEEKPLLYYPTTCSEEGYPYTLLEPVRLYEAMNITSNSAVIKAGIKIAFPATDNKQFVMVETEDGIQGYLYLENGSRIEMPEGGYYEWNGNVIEGLNFAG